MYRSPYFPAIGAPAKGEGRKPNGKKTRAVLGYRKATTLPKPIDRVAYSYSRQLEIVAQQEKANREEVVMAELDGLLDDVLIEELEGEYGVAFIQLNIHRLPTRCLIKELTRRCRLASSSSDPLGRTMQGNEAAE